MNSWSTLRFVGFRWLQWQIKRRINGTSHLAETISVVAPLHSSPPRRLPVDYYILWLEMNITNTCPSIFQTFNALEVNWIPSKCLNRRLLFSHSCTFPHLNQLNFLRKINGKRLHRQIENEWMNHSLSLKYRSRWLSTFHCAKCQSHTLMRRRWSEAMEYD